MREILLNPIIEFLETSLEYIPSIIGALVVFIIGWLVARLLAFLARKLIFALHLEKLGEKFKILQILRKGDIRDSIAQQFGKIIFWITLIFTIGLSANILNWEYLSDLTGTVLSYIPKLVLAIIIIIIAGFIGSFVGGIIRVKTSNITRVNSYLLGKIIQYTIVGIAVVMALERLNLSTPFLIITISIAFFGVVLTLSIATGLALKDRVSDIIETSIGEDRHIVLEEEDEE